MQKHRKNGNSYIHIIHDIGKSVKCKIKDMYLITKRFVNNCKKLYKRI